MGSWVTLALLSIAIPAYCHIDFKSFLTTRKPVYYEFKPTTTSATHENVVAPISAIALKREGCGWRQENGLFNRISGTTDAFFGELPWVIAIFKYSELKHTYEYCCVGSLIHPRLILSVKHYFKKPARIRIRAGDWNIDDESEIHPHQSSDVTKVLSHPNYVPKTNAYDAALLVLSTSINLAPNVGFACLPPPDTFTPSGTRCIVAGWGQETFSNATRANILKMTEVPAVDLSVCQARLSDHKGKPITIPDSMMCAGGEKDEDACLKDGGAPLVCPYTDQPGRYYQAGIVSWGIGCGLPDIPGVYTSVPKIREWVDETIKAMKYDITYVP